MSVYNEILVGRFNRALQKITAIKGGAPCKQLASEIIPVFPLFWGVETRYLESWQRFGNAFQVNAVAANNSAVRLRNPATSNVIAVIEKIFILTVTLSNETRLELGPATTDLAVDLSAFVVRFDARGQQLSALKLTQQNTAPLASSTNTFGSVQLLANTGTDVIWNEDQEITVLPGDMLQIRNTTVNTQLNCTMWWRERFLEDSERT